MARARPSTTSMSSMSSADPSARAIGDACVLQLPRIPDRRGNLTFLESRRHVPFEIRRAYWLYDVPGGDDRRGGHAYRSIDEFLIAMSGSFDITVSDGAAERVHSMNRSYFGLHVPAGLWRRLGNFSTNAVCLVLASAAYDPDDYMRDRNVYARWRAGGE